jgi:hypothetical protein
LRWINAGLRAFREEGSFPHRGGPQITVLIAYATTEGQPRKIARFCADRLSVRH